jgi:hypothetical protein
MYQFDTSTGYSLPRFEQINYAGLTQLPIVHGRFGPDRSIGSCKNQPTLVRPYGHKVVR